MSRIVYPLSADATPELALRAIEMLRDIAQDSVVLECGSGGSTLFLAKYARRLVSLEHDLGWYDEVKKWAWDCPNVYQLFLPPDEFSGFIDALDTDSLDVAFIDCYDKYRMDCVRSAMSRIKIGGHLVVDDVQWPMLEGLWNLLNSWNWDVLGGDVQRLSGECRPSKTGFFKRCS